MDRCLRDRRTGRDRVRALRAAVIVRRMRRAVQRPSRRGRPRRRLRGPSRSRRLRTWSSRETRREKRPFPRCVNVTVGITTSGRYCTQRTVYGRYRHRGGPQVHIGKATARVPASVAGGRTRRDRPLYDVGRKGRPLIARGRAPHPRGRQPDGHGHAEPAEWVVAKGHRSALCHGVRQASGSPPASRARRCGSWRHAHAPALTTPRRATAQRPLRRLLAFPAAFNDQRPEDRATHKLSRCAQGMPHRLAAPPSDRTAGRSGRWGAASRLAAIDR